MENNTADMRMTPDKIRECPFCKNAPFYRISEEMLDGNGEFEVLCIYNHCPISGIGIKMSVWQGATRTPAPSVTVEELAEIIRRAFYEGNSPTWVQFGNIDARTCSEIAQAILAQFNVTKKEA